MATIRWNDSMSVKVATIDDEHKQLISMVNELGDAMKSGKAKEISEKIISDMIRYTQFHFSNEERCLARHNYPELAAHKEEHMVFVHKVLEFKDGYEGGSSTVSIDMLRFLGKWLQQHIKGTDQRYSDFLASKGVK